MIAWIHQIHVLLLMSSLFVFLFFLVMLCLFFKWWMFSNLILLSKGTTFGLGHESDTGRWELPNKFAYFISILVLRVWKSKFSGYYGVTVCHKKKRDDNGIQCFPYNYYTMRCHSGSSQTVIWYNLRGKVSGKNIGPTFHMAPTSDRKKIKKILFSFVVLGLEQGYKNSSVHNGQWFVHHAQVG